MSIVRTRSPALDLRLLDLHVSKYNRKKIPKSLRYTERYKQRRVIDMTSSETAEYHALAQKHAALFYPPNPSRLVDFTQPGAIVRDILTTSEVSSAGRVAAWERKATRHDSGAQGAGR